MMEPVTLDERVNLEVEKYLMSMSKAWWKNKDVGSGANTARRFPLGASGPPGHARWQGS